MVPPRSTPNGTGTLHQPKDLGHAKSWGLVKRLIRDHVSPQRWRLAAVFLCMLIQAAGSTAMAKLMEPIVNAAFLHGRLDQLYIIAGMIVVVFSIRGWASFGQATLLNRIGQAMIASMQIQLFHRIIESDLAFFNRNSPGTLISRFLNDVGYLRASVADGLQAVSACMQVVGLIGLMFIQDRTLACVALIALPLAVLPISKIGKRMRRVSRSSQQESGVLVTALDEVFQGVRQVKAHGMESHEAARVGRTISTLFRLALKGARTRAYANPALETLVGPSGAGKTTVFNLILRFFDPESGRVTIDGQDLTDITLASLRASIALVSQDSLLFDDTVRANIMYGRPDATEADLDKAALGAHAEGFIHELPQGYDTPVGPRGVRLSGGQRQRILIARAILRNAPILLLDEATSSLDNESERIVQDALQLLKKGRTTIVIAHRLSTVVSADCIYVMEKGRVVEYGRHLDLIARDGVYARLYAHQFVDVDEVAPVPEAVA